MIRALKSIKNLHFDWSLLCKVYNVWTKKDRGVIFHDTEESDSGLENDTEETDFGLENDRNLANFHQNTWVSKLVFSWDPFVLSRKCTSYNLQRSYK